MPKDYAYRGRDKQKWPSKRKSSHYLRKKHRKFWHLKTPEHTETEYRHPWRAISLMIFLLAILTVAIIYVEHKLEVSLHPVHKIGAIMKAKPPVKTSKETGATPQPTASESNSASPQVKFDFYTTLPNMEVEVANEATQPTTVHETTSSKTAHKPQTQYMLQLISLPSEGDAIAYQQKLKALNINTKIFTAQHGKTTWHRVEMGPFRDKQAAKKTQQKLRLQNIDSILLTITLP